VSSWLGFAVDSADRQRVGRVVAIFVDSADGEPSWLVVGLGRRGRKRVAVALRECAAAAGRVWTAQPRSALGEAPAVDPSRPLLREHELAICAHYGIGESVGRAAEVAGREAGAVTSRPAA
jgi:hypothetical protein